MHMRRMLCLVSHHHSNVFFSFCAHGFRPKVFSTTVINCCTRNGFSMQGVPLWPKSLRLPIFGVSVMSMISARTVQVYFSESRPISYRSRSALFVVLKRWRNRRWRPLFPARYLALNRLHTPVIMKAASRGRGWLNFFQHCIRSGVGHHISATHQIVAETSRRFSPLCIGRHSRIVSSKEALPCCRDVGFVPASMPEISRAKAFSLRHHVRGSLRLVRSLYGYDPVNLAN